MDMNDINSIANIILKGRSEYDIVNDYESIKNLCINLIETGIINSKFDEKNKDTLINDLLNRIIIKGKPLDFFEKKFEERNNNKKLIKVLDDLKCLRKETKIINIDGIDFSIDVYNTGFSYIPADNYVYSQKLLDELKELWEKEKIEKIADILENGTASIHLDYETKIKVNEELEKRKKNHQKLDNTIISYENNSYDKGFTDSYFKDKPTLDGDSSYEEPMIRR